VHNQPVATSSGSNERGGAGSERLFGVVFVCSGNRFRSPLAEASLRRAASGLPLAVSSCGTLRLRSGPALSEAVEEAARLGLDLDAHESRCIDERAVADADLVLGFERRHLARALELGVPRERAFLLLELVLLLERLGGSPRGAPAERAAAAVAAAHRVRTEDARFTTPPDLADPLGKPREYQRYVAERVNGLAERLARGLLGPA
jgi:protein-tyrosine phosphatase